MMQSSLSHTQFQTQPSFGKEAPDENLARARSLGNSAWKQFSSMVGNSRSEPKSGTAKGMADALGQLGKGAEGNAGGSGNGDFASRLIETANALGMDPETLGTMISYETGGTFDPLQEGPTTQWGQHKGLIQFGEPQAEEYGVDWNNPLGSQLGRDGAIVRYFQQNGWQPGMSDTDAYSIINAGAPGRHNASDANNGGAPGTVADKVRNQMAGHRAKAQRLLAGNSSSFGTSLAGYGRTRSQ